MAIVFSFLRLYQAAIVDTALTADDNTTVLTADDGVTIWIAD